MNKKLFFVVILSLCAAASSCARSLSMDPLHFWGNAGVKEDKVRREAYAATHAELTQEQKTKILAGEIWKGMSKDEAIASRGLPHDIWRNFTDNKELEKWIYRYDYYYPENFLVFDRRSLVDWQQGWERRGK
ncbi:MAG: hypothetical protein HY587_04015 [Candidatus Omnitrophica bacterium]|nr:hypothetical protein [Candidatus Omnitrophota bacterium]